MAQNPTGTVGNPKTGTAAAGQGLPTVGTSPYAYNQVAPFTGMQQQGFSDIQNLIGPVSQYLQGMQGTGQQATGGVQTGMNTTNALQGAAGSAMPMQNWLSSGAAMNPASNPYLQQYFNAAAQPMEQQFQQTIAPNLLQNSAQTGTLGSAGAAQGMQNAQTALSQGLGNLAANIYEPAYQQGLQATQGAVNQGLNTGLSAAGQGINAGLNAMSQAPALSQAQFGPAQQGLQAGGQQQAQAQNIMNTATQNANAQANWPFQAMSMLGQGLGAASGGGQSGISSMTGSGMSPGK